LTKILAVAGKGGTGKTTLAALAVRSFVRGGRTPVLAIDADPNSNLGESLGVVVDRTIGDTREDFFEQKGSVPAGMSKESYLDMRLNQILIEAIGYDLLVMGRQEGPGCYCFINNILRSYSERLADNYKALVVDNEAGMEHISRRTTYKIDTLWMVTDHSLRGLRAVKRIHELIQSLKLRIESRGVVVNRAPATLDPVFTAELQEIGLPLLGTVPEDSNLGVYDMERRGLFDLPNDSVSVRAVQTLMSPMLS